MKVKGAIEEFITYLVAERQVAKQTLQWYRFRLEQFAKWIEEKSPEVPFSRRAFRHFVAYLSERALSPATVAGYIRVLKHFGRWLAEEGITDRNPAAGLKQPNLDGLPIKAILPEDADRIIETARDNPMHYALVMILRYTGARANEILSMRWDHLDLEKCYAIVIGKRKQIRCVYFKEEVARALKNYRETLGNDPPEKVFPITYNSLYDILRGLARKAGVKGPFNPHAWRHAFGREMSMNGCPTTVLQDLMGHSTPVVTKKYARFFSSELRAAYDRFAPWSRKEEEVESS